MTSVIFGGTGLSKYNEKQGPHRNTHTNQNRQNKVEIQKNVCVLSHHGSHERCGNANALIHVLFFKKLAKYIVSSAKHRINA